MTIKKSMLQLFGAKPSFHSIVKANPHHTVTGAFARADAPDTHHFTSEWHKPVSSKESCSSVDLDELLGSDNTASPDYGNEDFARTIGARVIKTEPHLLEVSIKKADADMQVVFGEVFIPNVPDSQNEFMTKEAVRETAYRFMYNNRNHQVDTDHDNELNGSIVVESFIAREGDPDFIADSWVVGVYVPDSDLWEKILNQELNGFSFEALEIIEDAQIELNIGQVLKGDTQNAEGHTHEFYVSYNDKGEYIGGYTSLVNGHSHNIYKGTVTEPTYGHSHRYSYQESLID